MRNIRIIMMLMLVGILVAGCSQEADLTSPTTQTGIDKDGTEELGFIAVPDGSGFLEAGVGMVDTDTGNFSLTVPDGATVVQVLLYWEGGTTSDNGDDTISINGTSVTGALIGGPTNFFENYNFYAYRADITAEGMVVAGLNNFEITDFDFDYSGNTLDENNGAGLLVIYDDGSLADLSLADGLDMAYFNFAGTLNSTVPKTFTFGAEDEARVADLVVFAGSVGENRPNQIKVTTTAGDQIFDNVLGSSEGLLWDSHVIVVDVPAGVTELTVELISVDSSNPRGASMAWIGTGLAVPVSPPPELACIGDYVWYDMNMDGIQDPDELPVEGVVVLLMDCEGNILDNTTTDANGYYEFCELDAGGYTINFVLPDNHVFSPMHMGGDPAKDSDPDPATGMSVCTPLLPGEFNHTIDAGIYVVPLACIGDYVWYDLNMDGIQDPDELPVEGVVVLLMDCEGNILDNTTTDANGYYEFCELDAGGYTINFVLPDNHVFSPMHMGGDPAKDSDPDPATGMSVCTPLLPGEFNHTIDAGIYVPIEEGCTLTIGFWKTHAGFGPQDDVLSQYLTITLGDEGGAKSLVVDSAGIAVDVLKMKTYGKNNNGITKLYAQLLAAKLNFAAGASDGDVADYVTDADAFLADHDYMDWAGLSDDDKDMVMMWQGSFDKYNNGDIGPGHCDDDDDDDDDSMDMFK